MPAPARGKPVRPSSTTNARTVSPTILDRSALARVGVSSRRPKDGPELDLLEEFVLALPFDVPRGCKATLFREPRLDSGFPDLVIVVWHPGTMRHWSDARAQVRPRDLRIVQFLIERDGASEADLREMYPVRLDAAMGRLENARLVRRVGRRWLPRSVNASFAVRRIIAIEAKISNWRAAAEQAYLNTWFTSESYVLLPDAKRGHPLLPVARRLGIGVLSRGQGLVRRPPSKDCQPRSYASWLFNEWAWRAALGDAG